MQWMLDLSRAIDRINTWIGRAVIWCILASAVIGASCALLRKLFRIGSNAWFEMQWHLFAAAFLLSAAYVLLVDEHVRVDALAARWSARVRAWLDIVALALIALPICAVMVVFGAQYAWQAYEIGEGSYMHDGLPLWPVRALTPIGFALLGLQSISEIIRRVLYLRGGAARPTAGEADLPDFPSRSPPRGAGR